MLLKMRAKAQGVFAKVLAGIIVFVLAVFGFGAFDLFSVSEPVAATVNGAEITQRALELETSRQRAIQRSQFPEDVPVELIEQLVNREAVLQMLVDRALLDQAAADLDLSIAEDAVQAQIRREVGVTDQATYRNLLANQGYTPSSFQEAMAEAATRRQFDGAVAQTSFATKRESRFTARLQAQRRDVAWLHYDVEGLKTVGVTPPSEADLERHYAIFSDDFLSPERFDFDVVRLPRSSLEPLVEVDEEAVVAAFEDEIATLAPRRHGAHILLEVDAERSVEEATEALLDMRAEISAGADFAEKARAFSEDAGSAELGGDLGAASRGIFAPEFEDALWALEPGDLSLPVETEFGVHLIKLIAIEEPEVPSLEERRPDIVADLRREELARLFDETLRDMEEIAFEQGDSLDALVAEYDLRVEPLDGIVRDSTAGVFADRAVRDALFADDVLLEGYNSEAVATADNQEAIVGRLRQRHPQAQRPLAEVREEVRAALLDDSARAMAERAAFEALAALAEGSPATEIATKTGVGWERKDGMGIDETEVPQPIVRTAFKMAVPAPDERGTDVAVFDDGSRAVVVLSAVSLADYDALTEADRNAVAQALQSAAAGRDRAALLATLRSDSSVSTIDFKAES